jgi:hypothetical protein
MIARIDALIEVNHGFNTGEATYMSMTYVTVRNFFVDAP